MEKTLKEQYVPTAEFYSQLIDSLHDYAIFTVDKDLNVNSWNSGATKIFQYTTEEIIGEPFDIIFTEKDKEQGVPQLEIDVALKSGRSNDIRWHLCKDGSTFYADGLVFPLKNEDDDLIGYVKILRDITARKASEDAIKKYAQELETLNTHKETVLAILSHDLRSPLAGIIQGAEFLKMNYDTIDSESARELLHEFHKAAVNELNMLDYLVEWARIKYAAEACTPSKINLSLNVEKVFESLKETAAINHIFFRNNIGDDCYAYADEKMIISVLQNLVSNAVKHSHDRGEVTVSAEEKDTMLLVEIKDTGKGMPKDLLDTLFTPQVHSLSISMDTKKGAGIGLLLAKGFIEKNGGRIWVESMEGAGSSFYFTLPMDKPLDNPTVSDEEKVVDNSKGTNSLYSI